MMHIEQRESESFASFQLVNKCRICFFISAWVGIAEVDQITVMGKNVFPVILIVNQVFPELSDCRCGVRRGKPLALVFGEHAEGRGAEFMGVDRGVLHPAGR